MHGETSFSVDNIFANDGIGIAITGMLIVFVALVLITIFVALMPKVLGLLAGVLPPEIEHHAALVEPSVDNEALAVAIGFALHSKPPDQGS